MTWPFENDTSAIVKKLADRSMKADKRSKTFLLLTIALSVCMVFSIILISTGTQEEFKNTQRNKAQIGILGVTDEQTALLRQNKDISWIGEYSAIGFFYVDDKQLRLLMEMKITCCIRKKRLYREVCRRKKMRLCFRRIILTF